MKIHFIIAAFLSNPLCPSLVFAQTAPDSKPVSLESKIRPETRLVIIGETHETHQSNRAEIEALSQLKSLNPNLNCYFAEWDHSSFAKFKDFNSGSSYETSIQLAIDEFKNDFGGVTNLVPKNLMEHARSLGLRIIPVDIDWHSTFGRPVVNDVRSGHRARYLNDRNLKMAANIARVMRTKICDRAVLIVGSAHVFERLIEGQVVRTMPELLDAKAIKQQAFEAPPYYFNESPL